jgi:hypothetical protein
MILSSAAIVVGLGFQRADSRSNNAHTATANILAHRRHVHISG